MDKPRFNVKIRRTGAGYRITVYWENPPGFPDDTMYATHIASVTTEKEILKQATHSVMDMLARLYGEKGPRGLYGWRGVYYTMQHHVRRELKRRIREAFHG